MSKNSLNQQQTIELNRLLLMKSSRMEKKAYRRAELVRINPKSFRDAKHIAKELRNYNAVIVDFEKVTDKETIRIMDFLSGVLYAMGGKHRRLSDRSFFLTPIPDLTEKFSSNIE
ncbi:/ sepF / Cell division protein SepF /:221725 Forward [Candidatus Hepatoplasma crinochetorum]|uniref:/ sepF / Cell division protein SepF /:221725 Forward n=1 Tax=Candidatus Hepatoplasma crinochetorum TaxID=295596 RepID=A0A0G7ZNK3_9MOLU|nr:/ sepF / Cell division protein SepF /:221725 Forward [Candidatus Hepatoplasma crinochetorum]